MMLLLKKVTNMNINVISEKMLVEHIRLQARKVG